jgi:hypothetical protein
MSAVGFMLAVLQPPLFRSSRLVAFCVVMDAPKFVGSLVSVSASGSAVLNGEMLVICGTKF